MLQSDSAAHALNIPQYLCLDHLLRVQAGRFPDALAILAPGRTPLTYGRLYAHLEEVAQRLQVLGLGRHDRVALILANGPEMAVAFLTIAASATCVPLNPAYSAYEYDFYLAHLRVQALLIQAGMASPARAVAQTRGLQVIDLAPVSETAAGLFTLTSALPAGIAPQAPAQPDDVALVLHTSGSTSRPKCVPLTHANLCTAAHNMCVAFALAESDRCLNVLPLFHLHGLMTSILAPLVAGASTVCTPGFEAPHFFPWLAEFRPTWYTAVPTIHQGILARAALHRETIACCPLRFIRSGSAALPMPVREELERVFNTRVLETYGMTEASGHVTCSPLPWRARKPGSVGVAIGPEVAIMDAEGTLLPAGESGEIVVRGATVMQGYDNDPVANQHAFKDRWFRSGDQGYLDSDGYLFVTGRLKEIINRGGQKITPQEVEEVLLDHPAVAQAVTFAVPHTQLGEDIAAAVVLRQGARATENDLRTFIATRLAAFKVPRQVCIVDELPQSATGKLYRLGLAEWLSLIAPDATAPMLPPDFATPYTPIEEILAGLWSQVLGVDRVGRHDNFFALGGDSLLATQLLTRVGAVTHIEVSFLSFFDMPTVAGMARLIQNVSQAAPVLSVPPLRPVPRQGGLPVSVAQEQMWSLAQVLPGLPLFNVPYTLHLRGDLNAATLEQSLNQIIRRHEALRTTFATVSGRVVQVIAPHLSVPLEIVDLCPLPEDAREGEAQRRVDDASLLPFDLTQGPLLRTTLLRLSAREHVLLLMMHHIICDGWSLGVLTHELILLYDAFCTGKPSPLPALPIQYADFTHWQGQWHHSEARAAQLAYWTHQLQAPLPMLALPTDRPRRGATGSLFPARQSFLVPAALSEALKSLSYQAGSTLFMALLAACKMLLYGYTGQEDLCVGTLVANRNQRDTEGLIGFFVNTVLLRTHLDGDPTGREVLQRVRTTTLDAYAHQDLPFEELAQTLEHERGLDRTSLCQVMLVLHNAMLRPVQLSARTLSFEEADWYAKQPEVNATTFDIILVLRERPQGLSGLCLYQTSLFDPTTVEQMLEDFQEVLARLTSQPEQRLSTFRSLGGVGG